MLKLNKAVFLLQSVCCDSYFQSCKSSSTYFKQLRMNVNIAGKENTPMLLTLVTFCHHTLMFCEIIRELFTSVSALTAISMHSDCSLPCNIHSHFGQAVSVRAGECRQICQLRSWPTWKNHHLLLQFILFFYFYPVLLPHNAA